MYIKMRLRYCILMTTYNDIVEIDEKTCSACPTQWEGKLNDGRSFYFRYRWGGARLSVAETVDDAVGGRGVNAHAAIGSGLDGVLNDDEYREVFVRLYNELA